MSEIKIRDLYTGKPDAKDEINFEGLEEFIKTFVVADHFQLDSLLYGNNCFITGFKGTGKTALLFYLDNKLKDEDPYYLHIVYFFSKKSLPMLSVTNYKQYPIGFYHQFQ